MRVVFEQGNFQVKKSNIFSSRRTNQILEIFKRTAPVRLDELGNKFDIDFTLQSNVDAFQSCNVVHKNRLLVFGGFRIEFTEVVLKAVRHYSSPMPVTHKHNTNQNKFSVTNCRDIRVQSQTHWNSDIQPLVRHLFCSEWLHLPLFQRVFRSRR